MGKYHAYDAQHNTNSCYEYLKQCVSVDYCFASIFSDVGKAPAHPLCPDLPSIKTPARSHAPFACSFIQIIFSIPIAFLCINE